MRLRLAVVVALILSLLAPALALAQGAYPVVPFSQSDQVASGPLALGTASTAFTVGLTGGRGTLGLAWSGVQGTGAAMVVEAQNGAAAAWSQVACVAPNTGANIDASATGITTDTACRVNAEGHSSIRLRVLTASGSAANAAVSAYATVGAGIVTEINSSAIAASTAADATNNSAFAGQTQMVAGTTYLAGRSLYVIATAAGTLNLTLADGSTLPYPITGPGLYQLPFSVTQIQTSSTASFSYASNLK